jgi:hypothetical protein
MVFLKAGGVASTSIAVLHVLIIIWGGPAYRYFGAGEQMARLAEAGSLIPALVTAGISAVFVVWAAYAFSGAGLLSRLPLLRTGLVVIGVVYLLRGMLLAPELFARVSGHQPAVPVRELVFSLAALLAGLAYLLGTRSAWANLSPAHRG